MAKLIFADKLESFKTQFSGWNDSSKEAYRSIAFCEDGYIVTHGKTFRTPLGTNENIYGLGINLSNGKLTVSAGGYTTTDNIYVLTSTGNTTYITGSNSNGIASFTHVKPADVAAKDITSTSKGSTTTTETDSSATVTGGITFDNYGHVHSAVSRNLVLNRVRATGTVTDTVYYILGHAASGDSTAEAFKNTNVYIKNGDLYASNLYLGSSKQSITDIISASQALYFRGTIDSTLSADDTTNKKYKTLPTTNVNVGDLYVVGSGGYTIGSGDSAEVCEAGDMIICTIASTSTTSPSWSAVQRNLVNALTENNLNGTTSGNKLKVYIENGNLYVTQTDTNTWRPVSINGTALYTSAQNTTLDFKAGTGIKIDSTSTAGKLTFTNTSPLSSATNLKFQKLAKTSGATATDILTYNPNSTEKTLVFKEGDNVTLSYANNTLTIASSYINNTYSIYAGGSGATSNAKTATANDATYINLASSGTDSSHLQLLGSGSVAVSAKDGVITFTGTNTWRNVSAYKLDNTHAEVLSSTIGTSDLDFGSEFAWTKKTDYGDDSESIHLVWAEVTTSADGKTVSVSYAV